MRRQPRKRRCPSSRYHCRWRSRCESAGTWRNLGRPGACNPNTRAWRDCGGFQGSVILEVTVDRQGNVSNVAVLRSVDGLDAAAVEAVRQWRYEPTIINGRPVSVVLTDTVRFQLNN